MLRFDFSHKAHANFQIFFCTQCVFQLIDAKSTSIPFKIEVHIESNFHFSVSIDVFLYHFNATNIKSKIILGV